MFPCAVFAQCEGSPKLMTSTFQVVAFIVGFVYEDIYLTLWTGLAGTVVTALAVIPPWPVYNKNPESWLVVPNPQAGAGIVVDGVKVA